MYTAVLYRLYTGTGTVHTECTIVPKKNENVNHILIYDVLPVPVPWYKGVLGTVHLVLGTLTKLALTHVQSSMRTKATP